MTQAQVLRRYRAALSDEGKPICPECAESHETIGAFAAPILTQCDRCGRHLEPAESLGYEVAA